MPVITRRDYLPARAFAKSIAGLVLLLILGLCGTALHAQTIRIKLLNGRNGHAMADTCVNVWVGNERKSAMAIPTDKEGVASLRLTDSNKDDEASTQKHWEGCGTFGVVNPVAKYAGSIRINAGYVLCQVSKPDHTWLAIQKFSTREVLQSGIVTRNRCGKANASQTPGEVVLFVRPLTWWEKLKE